MFQLYTAAWYRGETKTPIDIPRFAKGKHRAVWHQQKRLQVAVWRRVLDLHREDPKDNPISDYTFSKVGEEFKDRFGEPLTKGVVSGYYYSMQGALKETTLSPSHHFLLEYFRKG